MAKLTSFRPNVTLFDRGILETDPVAGNNQTRLFFGNPAANSRSRTPAQTNMQQPGTVPANSAIKIKALALEIEPQQIVSNVDVGLNAAFTDLIRLLRTGTFELFVGASNDARIAIPLEDILQTRSHAIVNTVTNAEASVGDSVGSVRIGERNATLGVWWPIRSDAIQVSAFNTFQFLIEHQEQANFASTLDDPIITGLVQADLYGELAQQFGQFQ